MTFFLFVDFQDITFVSLLVISESLCENPVKSRVRRGW